MADESLFAVTTFDALVWPQSLNISSPRFRLFVAADTTRATTEEISTFAENALAAGMVYFCAWGPGCERLHDIVDDVLLEDELGRREFVGAKADDAVMTTWHNHESLEEALDFFARCAVPTEGFADDSSYWLAIAVGHPEWASVANQVLRAAASLGNC